MKKKIRKNEKKNINFELYPHPEGEKICIFDVDDFEDVDDDDVDDVDDDVDDEDDEV